MALTAASWTRSSIGRIPSSHLPQLRTRIVGMLAKIATTNDGYDEHTYRDGRRLRRAASRRLRQEDSQKEEARELPERPIRFRRLAPSSAPPKSVDPLRASDATACLFFARSLRWRAKAKTAQEPRAGTARPGTMTNPYPLAGLHPSYQQPQQRLCQSGRLGRTSRCPSTPRTAARNARA